ncbi:MAG: alkaline phosphatase D family protein [Verrucomicrobiota bacterium]
MKFTFSLTRRLGLKLLAFGSVFGLKSRSAVAQDAPPVEKNTISAATPLENWRNTHDRVWLGGHVWANPMEDWAIADGWATCNNDGTNRSIHSLTHQLTDPAEPFGMSVKMGLPATSKKNSGGGFRVGVKSDINEFRSNCFASGGIDAGLVGRELVLGKNKAKVGDLGGETEFRLRLSGVPAGDKCQLTLSVKGAQSGKVLAKVTSKVNGNDILGNVAIVSNYAGSSKKARRGMETPAYRFAGWSAGGDAFTVTEDHRFGPILWSMYSLSDSRSEEGFVLKISALTGPMGTSDNQLVALEIKDGSGDWKSLGEATLDPDAWTATFRIPNWNEKNDTPYRLVYVEKGRDGSEARNEWAGTIKANPNGRPVRLAAMTCQNDYGFPYKPVANNIVKLDPDMVYFSGDQLYESHGGFGVIRDPADPAILNYLRKFYQFGWAFREAMRNAPTICIPDDHDVFHGNIWGEGGAAMADRDKGTSSKGGYIQPAKMVNVVHKTSCGHHPDLFDSTPVKQGISVYYGDMVYGGVSFAIVGDRQFKSGPGHVETGSGRADHVHDRNFDTSVLDKPGLQLLGERQEKFLEAWAEDWRGHSMKVLLSETVFAAVATHHGKFDGYLQADLDSGSWPQTARNNAIRILRKSKALHVNGDQHLTTMCQYGTDEQRDSNWSFCTPAIAAGYPRWWRPDDEGIPHEHRPGHGNANTGEFTDGFGNKVYVYAVGNPEVGTLKNRYEKAHQKGSGFGLVTIDTKAKTYLCESFRFNIDPTDGNPDNQFPGWPVTIHQRENGGENVIA